MRLLFLFCVFLLSCKSGERKNSVEKDTYDEGKINISAEYNFKPIIDELVRTYRSKFPKAQLHVTYKTYKKCQADILNDSVSIIFCSNVDNTKYSKVFKDIHRFSYRYDLLAFDAIVFFTNQSNKLDEALSYKDIKALFSRLGKYKDAKFFSDAPVLSSSLQYLVDSFGGIKSIKHIYSTQNPQDQLEQVGKYKYGYGFVNGMWFFYEKQNDVEIYDKVQILGFQPSNKDTIYYPTNKNLIDGNYPFFQRMFYISRVNHVGLASSFVNYVSQEQGQLIIEKAKLIPAKMSFRVRKVLLR